MSENKIFKNIKLIVADVDDTLVKESHMNLNPEYFDVIRSLQEKGVMFVGASGRQKVSLKKVFEPIKDEIIYLADNGTDIETKDFSVSMKFEDEDYKKLAQEIEDLGGDFQYMPCKPDWAYVDETQEEFYNLLKKYEYQMEKVKNLVGLKDICKISLYHPEGIPKELELKMKEEWADKMDVCIAGSVYLDFTKKDCNKGNGVSILQKHYGITPEETVTFGNADNDISMIRRSKYGYAVGNASENLKKEAYEIIGEMKDDAVLKKMKEILRSL